LFWASNSYNLKKKEKAELSFYRARLCVAFRLRFCDLRFEISDCCCRFWVYSNWISTVGNFAKRENATVL